MEAITSGIKSKFLDNLKFNIFSSFPDSKALLNFFLENKFKPEFCNAIIKNEKIISSIQAFPQEIILDGKSFSAKYIYAAATLPDFRGKGFMEKLLNFTAEIERKQNTDFLFLVPCCEQIEKYYEKMGYKNFFKIRKINFSGENFKKLIAENACKDACRGEFECPMEKICNMVYNNTNYVRYSREDISYAIKLYSEFFTGKVVTTGKNFAICLCPGNNILKIMYFCAENIGDSKSLLHAIYREFPGCLEYQFNICTENEFFTSYGRSKFYGMIKPLNFTAEKAVINIKKSEKFAYLGLPLD